MYEFPCGMFECLGVLRVDRPRPYENQIVQCEPRPGETYGSSCHSPMRWDDGQERFVPYPEALLH